jgi:hypothetical protein
VSVSKFLAWVVVNGWKGRQHMPRAVNRAS